MQIVCSSLLLIERHFGSIHRLPSRFFYMSVAYVARILKAERLLSADFPVHRIEPFERTSVSYRMSLLCALYVFLWQEYSLCGFVYLCCT